MSAQLKFICNHTNETATKWYLFQSTRGLQQAIDKVYKHPYASTGSSELRKTGCKESQFYSLPFVQAVATLY